MRINWCDKHNLVGGAWCAMKDKAAGPCRMVPMRLIPDNEETVNREALRGALYRLPAISAVATDRHSIPADRLLILATAARAWLTLDGETP